MARLPSRLLALTVAAVLLAGCAYHAGDEAARDFDAWVKDHPLAGAKVTDSSGTNVQPFQGTFEADAQLTATPSESTIVTAMASMCRFDKETSAKTTYWLLVDKLWLNAPCSKDDQQKMAGFWTAVHGLDGYSEIDLSPKGMAVTAEDASITTLVPQLSDAADATGRAPSSTSNTYTSDRVTITQKHGADISDQLTLIQGVLDAAGDKVTAVQAEPGRISVATSGSVAEAQQWQQAVGKGEAQLTVTPNHVTTEVPFTAAGRDLVERLSTDARVASVEVVKPFWTIHTNTTDDARSLVKSLDHEPGTGDLGQLILDVGTKEYNSANGEGRTCDVRPVFPESNGRAAALLDLCDLKEAVEVDDRFDAALDLRLHGVDLEAMLACLHRMPYGQPVYLQLPQGATISFSTGEQLKPEFPQSDLAKQLTALWDKL